MTRRWLLRAASVVGILILLLAVVVVTLRLTNPGPSDSDGWERLADMPEQRGEVAGAVAEDGFVVAGGLTGVGATSDAVAVYDIRQDEWTSGDALPAPRHHGAMAGMFGYVYFSGGAPGATDWTPQDTFWRSQPGSVWAPLASMPEPRLGHDMVALDGALYVVGGVGPTDATLIYRPEDGWSKAAPLPQGRDHLKAVAWDGKIWALGGRSDGVLARVDVYDPASDTWSDGPALPTPMSAMVVGVVRDELHVIGGELPSLGGGVLDDHFVLPPGSTRWSEGAAPVLAVHGAGGAVHGNRLYMAGGASRQGALSVLSWTNVTQVFG